MKARLYLNHVKSGSMARDFIKFVKGACPNPVKETKESKTTEATEILESFHQNDQNPNEIDLGIMNGEFLNRRLDNELTEFKVVPYFLTEEARSKGEGIREGDSAYLLGDDRIFDVVHISYESESIRLRDDNENEFVVPWHLLVPSK